MQKRPIYSFEDTSRIYDRVLKELDKNRVPSPNQKYENKNKNKRENQHYLQYLNDKQNEQKNRCSIEKIRSIHSQFRMPLPNNQVRTRSIYTQEQSQYFGNSRIYQQDYNEEDIYKFIQNSKTLREKINEKLEKKKKNNQNRNKIVQTTFRPNQLKENHSKQNRPISNISYPKILTKRQNPKSSNIKKTRMRTQIDEANSLWEKKCQKTISMLDFYQRQQKTLTDRREMTKKLAEKKRQKQMEGCTFKPKLTKYRPKRP